MKFTASPEEFGSSSSTSLKVNDVPGNCLIQHKGKEIGAMELAMYFFTVVTIATESSSSQCPLQESMTRQENCHQSSAV